MTFDEWFSAEYPVDPSDSPSTVAAKERLKAEYAYVWGMASLNAEPQPSTATMTGEPSSEDLRPGGAAGSAMAKSIAKQIEDGAPGDSQANR